MPNQPTRFDDWSAGFNNVAQPDRLPPKCVRTLLNLNAGVGGTLELRAGYARVMGGLGLRAAGAAGRTILVVQESGLTAYDTTTGAQAAIPGTIGDGKVATAEHNRQLYLSTPGETWRFDGALKPWGIGEPGVSFNLMAGGLTGVVKVGVTALGADGEESGCEPYIFTLANQSIAITSTDPRPLRVYVSPPNHETLYFQTEMTAGSALITTVRDETERLVTAGLRPFPACSMLASYHGMIVGAFWRYVVCSEPMMVHLHNPMARFFQYASPVTLVVPTDGGVFVATDTETYFLSSLETSPAQRLVLRRGAVAGTGVALPDGRATWFTGEGQAVGSPDGSVKLINDDRLAPDTAATGAAALVEHKGDRMVVTTMRGPVRHNGLGIGFQSDLET